MGKIVEMGEVFGSDDSADIRYDENKSVKDVLDELVDVFNNNFNEGSF